MISGLKPGETTTRQVESKAGRNVDEARKNVVEIEQEILLDRVQRQGQAIAAALSAAFPPGDEDDRISGFEGNLRLKLSKILCWNVFLEDQDLHDPISR